MENKASDAAGVQEISSPRFAAFYNWMMGRPLVRRMFDPLRQEILGQAQGAVLEVGAGGGQNFPFYDPARVVRVEAVEPDEAMLVEAQRALSAGPVPITLTRASVESLPLPDGQFDSAVATLVFCSVQDPERGLREIWRVLKPGGRSCCSNMCAHKDALPPGCRMRSCPLRPAAWVIAIGIAIPWVPFCTPVSRPCRCASSAQDSSRCCLSLRDVLKRSRR